MQEGKLCDHAIFLSLNLYICIELLVVMVFQPLVLKSDFKFDKDDLRNMVANIFVGVICFQICILKVCR